jgi:hypothetical protein
MNPKRGIRIAGALVILACLIWILAGGIASMSIASPSSIAGTVVYHPPTAERKYSYFHYIPESALRREPIRVLLYGHGVPCSRVCAGRPPCSPPRTVAYSRVEELVRTIEIPRMRRCM